MQRFRLGDVRVNLDCLAAHHPTHTVALTEMEGRLLEALFSAEGVPVPRPTLLQEVWGYAPTSRSRTVFTTVHRLRQKIEQDPRAPEHLVTVRGAGVALQGAEPLAASIEVPQADELLGREAELRQLRAAGAGLIAVVGAIGVGKSALVRTALAARPGSVVVDCEAVVHPGDLWAHVAAAIPGRVEASVAGVRAWLAAAQQPVLVLDGLACSLALEVPPGATVVVTRTSPVAGATVVRLGSLRTDDAEALLARELERLGHAVVEHEVQTVVGATDRLPLEIVLAAPVLGLFGVEAACDAVADELELRVERALSHLDPERRALLQRLAVFQSPFDVGAAQAVAGLSAAETRGGLRLLMERGLVRRGDGGFKVLNVVRRQLEPPGDALDALAGWLVDNREQGLRDGGALARRHLPEVERVIVRSTDEQLGAFADLLWDAGAHEGTTPRILRLASRLAARGHDPWADEVHLGARVALVEPLEPEERARLEDLAAEGRPIAAFVLYQHTWDERWKKLAVEARPEGASLARSLPLTQGWMSRETRHAEWARLRRLARAGEWTAVLANLSRSEQIEWLHQDRADLVLAVRPDGDPQLMLVCAVALLTTGASAEALALLSDPVFDGHPLHTMRLVVRAVARQLEGADPLPDLVGAVDARYPLVVQGLDAVRQVLGLPAGAVVQPGLRWVLDRGTPPPADSNNLVAMALLALVRHRA